MKHVKLLRRARNILRKTGFTTGAHARNRYGTPAHALSENATCYCIEGALVRAHFELTGESDPKSDFKIASFYLRRAITNRGIIEIRDPSGPFFRNLIPGWNDQIAKGKTDALKLFGEAIEAAS